MILRHLEYLVALARERHFGRAAATCGVTQPTLSAAIRELEAELDILIVERGRSFGGLTAEGARVVEWARRILSDRDALRQEVGSARQGLSGHLILGVIPTALGGVGLLISQFQQNHPRVRIKVLSLSSIEIQRGLDIFDLDAGVSYLDNEPLLRVGTLPLYRERYFLVTGDRRVFHGRDSVTWAEAADLPLCLLTADMQNRRIVDAVFHEAKRAPAPLVETNSLLALYAQVRSRGMASILTQASLYLLGMPRWLRAFPLVEPAARRMIGLVYPDRKPQQPVARAFVDDARRLNIEGEIKRAIPPALWQPREP